MITNTAVVLMQVIAKISPYAWRCVSPVIASRVMIAPLCGNVSIPPQAIAATRCRTSNGMCAATAAALNCPAIAASARLRPPEAEPVIPASAVTAIASLTSGFAIAFIADWMATNPGSAAITAPNPNSDAVFNVASRQPVIASWLAFANDALTRDQANTTTVAMPRSSAASTAHTPICRDTSSTSGVAAGVSASVAVAPYQRGINPVNTMFITATTPSGRQARYGETIAAPSAASGSLRWPLP